VAAKLIVQAMKPELVAFVDAIPRYSGVAFLSMLPE
jgi:hypothetical protein